MISHSFLQLLVKSLNSFLHDLHSSCPWNIKNVELPISLSKWLTIVACVLFTFLTVFDNLVAVFANLATTIRNFICIHRIHVKKFPMINYWFIAQQAIVNITVPSMIRDNLICFFVFALTCTQEIFYIVSTKTTEFPVIFISLIPITKRTIFLRAFAVAFKI